jgi:dTDP-4-amino-4,6-dideoxygalactose transaminase
VTSRAFRVVELFEEAMCEYTGAYYGVAVESCSMALFLSLIYKGVKGLPITIPSRTYISVPAAIRHAGGIPVLLDYPWQGCYFLDPTNIIDSALRLHKGMYQPDTMTCVSFHMRKILPIGRGGMILTDDKDAAEWLRKARIDGRDGSIPFLLDQVQELGWNGYMTPEQAARGLQLLENLPDDPPDLIPDYPDLSRLPALH